jgi:hypothetical protein
VKYIDCPDDLSSNIASVYINKASISAARGYVLLIKKRYGLFTTPTDAYDGADALAGSNGTLRYSISNT